ncbi:unnamed protein product, partial [Linum tenue]
MAPKSKWKAGGVKKKGPKRIPLPADLLPGAPLSFDWRDGLNGKAIICSPIMT